MPGHLGTYQPQQRQLLDLDDASKVMIYTDDHASIQGFDLPGLKNIVVKDRRENTPARVTSDELEIYIDGEIYDDSLSKLDEVDHIQNKVEILQKANGYFSAVLLAKRESLIYWISDRFGLKPLYIHRGDSDISWATELKALQKIVDIGRIDSRAIGEYLKLGYLPGDLTWYEKVRLLPAATTLKLDLKTGELTSSRYWSWNEVPRRRMSFNEAVNAVSHELRQAIERRSEEGQKHTLALSGGLDSRYLGVMLADKDPLFFTFGHDGSDDAILAQKVSTELDVRHRLFRYTRDNWLKGKVGSIWRTEGMMPFFHLHASPFCKSFHELGDTVFNGFGGASLLGGLFIGKTRKMLRDVKNIDIDMDHNRAQLPESLVVDHHMRRFVNQGSIDVGKFLVQRKPYMDADLIDMLFSFPDRYRRNHRLFHEMMRRNFSDGLLDIPWENTGSSIRSPWLNRSMQRFRWPGIRRRMRMGRPAFDYRDLADESFTDMIENRFLNDRALIWDVIDQPDRYMVRPFRNLQVAGRLLSLELWLQLSAGQLSPDEDLTRF